MLRTITILFLFLSFVEQSNAKKNEVRKDSVWEVNKKIITSILSLPYALNLGFGSSLSQVSYGNIRLLKVTPQFGYQGLLRGEVCLSKRVVLGLSSSFQIANSDFLLGYYDSTGKVSPYSNNSFQVLSFLASPYLKLNKKIKNDNLYLMGGVGFNFPISIQERINSHYVPFRRDFEVLLISDIYHYYYNCYVGYEHKFCNTKTFIEVGYLREIHNWGTTNTYSWLPTRYFTSTEFPNYSLQLNIGIRF
ncbi:MAG: hypothetical protein NTX03_14555 [Bacteroidetes bacterium]|nr:hypothetical protein [Bacteroidota bacterium]